MDQGLGNAAQAEAAGHDHHAVLDGARQGGFGVGRNCSWKPLEHREKAGAWGATLGRYSRGEGMIQPVFAAHKA